MRCPSSTRQVRIHLHPLLLGAPLRITDNVGLPASAGTNAGNFAFKDHRVGSAAPTRNLTLSPADLGYRVTLEGAGPNSVATRMHWNDPERIHLIRVYNSVGLLCLF